MKSRIPLVIAVVGPTASGKSQLAVDIAQSYNGEIISADSRQVYRGLDIGTGKITKKETKGIPHYLLDIRNPQNQYSAAEFKRDAEKKIDDINAKGKMPIVVGGTGFWIDTLLLGLSLPEVPPHPALRKKLEKYTTPRLFDMLKRLDPARARSIDRKNPRRLIRAIEIAKAIGQVPPPRKRSPYRVLWIGLDPKNLRENIHERLHSRIQRGLFEEGKRLRKKGLSLKRLREFGLEYRSIAEYLERRVEKNAVIAELEKAINAYAKRQMTWFKRNHAIHWVKNKNEALRLVRTFVYS